MRNAAASGRVFIGGKAMFARLVPFACAAALAVGCSKPTPPKVTPVGAKIRSVVPNGINLDVKLSAYNPNSFDLPVQSVTANVVVDGKHDLGTFTIPHPVTLAAKKKTNIELPVEVRWSDILGLAQLAMSKRDVDYVVKGEVELGGEMLHVTIPYKVTGKITHQELMKAGGKGLNRIPGLN
jgi:LEA14-like dessication related protein